MHPPQRKPIACFTPRAMQVVRELGSRGEIETHNTRRDVNISNVRVLISNTIVKFQPKSEKMKHEKT